MPLANLRKNFKQNVYEKLMSLARYSVKLKHNTASLNVGEIVYLDNVNKKDEEEETLILIHGMGADKDTWLPLAKYLTKKYRIIIPDLPGHGESTQKYSLKYDIKSQAGYVLDLLKSLNIKHAHFIGSSMGGAIVTKIAYTHPEVVQKLILIDSYGAIKTQSYISRITEETGFNPMLEIHNVSDYKNMMSLAMIKPPYVPGFMLEILAENMTAKVKLNKKIFNDIESDCDLTSILPNIKAPVLVIWGDSDNILHIDNSELFKQQLQNCSIIIIEKAGHVPMVELPKSTAKHINQFILEMFPPSSIQESI